MSISGFDLVKISGKRPAQRILLRDQREIRRVTIPTSSVIAKRFPERAVPNIVNAIAGGKDNRNGECVGSAVVTIQIHIQHGGVEHLHVDQGNGLIDRGGRGHGFASEIGQPLHCPEPGFTPMLS